MPTGYTKKKNIKKVKRERAKRKLRKPAQRPTRTGGRKI